MKKIYTVISFFFCFFSQAQVGIGTTSPNSSAVLELKSSSRGLLIPRVSLLSTSDVVTVPLPAQGLLVYNISSISDVVPGFYYWDVSWKALKTTISPSSGTAWSLGGNIISGSDFIGSVNYNPLQFKVNNTLFGKFYPNGGQALGIGAIVNENNSIAIGTNANASASNQATAIGSSSVASGYQSSAFGFGATSSNNSSMGLGFQAVASGYQSLALGLNATASGQNSSAIGFQANAVQDNSIILGNPSNNSNKIGIGTNTPDERLHVVGSLKLVDGTQGNGYVLSSDANGKAKWQDLRALRYYGNIYYNSTGQTVNQFNNITFGAINSSNGITVSSDGITVDNSGIYKVTYSVTLNKTSGSSTPVSFNLYKNFNTLLPGTLSSSSINNNQSCTLTATAILPLNAFDKVSVRSNISDSTIICQPNGTSLTIDNIQ